MDRILKSSVRAFVVLAAAGALANALGSIDITVKSEYSSASKQYLLHIDPSDSWGRGQADYRLLRNNKEVWHKTLPFTLYDACVLDDGTVVGDAYTQGPTGHGGKSHEDHGDLVFSIIDPQGNIRVKEAYGRSFSDRWSSAECPEPQALSIISDPDNDRVFFLMTSYQTMKPVTVWRQFQLSTGKPLGVFYPTEQMKDAEGLCWRPRVQPLPSTPLLLAQWKRLEGEFSVENPPLYGAYFALLDMKCNPVWGLTLRDDYEVSDDEKSEDALQVWVQENSAILSVKAPGHFDLYFAKLGQRVSFAATQDENGKWAVVETGRKGYTPPGLAMSRTNTASEGKPKLAPSESPDRTRPVQKPRPTPN